jgi:CRISPR-associated protein (TIGR02584 family)
MPASPTEPATYPRRALVCLAGLTPQVITETLFALIHQEKPAFVPTELHVVCTAQGAAAVRERLLGPAGALQRLQREWLGRELIEFDPARHLHIVMRGGVALQDIETAEDCAAVADLLIEVLRPLADDPDCAVHASIAGGRKSMGFYLGYAMSLLGRPQDRLSHVLVNAPFEWHPDFFFPPAQPRQLGLAGGAVVSTEQARVVLAPITFVRLSQGLRDQVMQGGLGFEGLVARAQASLAPAAVELSPALREVRVPGGGRAVLEPALMAWYTFFALRRREGMRESELLLAPGLVFIHKDTRRSIGFDQALLDQACRRTGIEPQSALLDPAELRYRVSAINAALRRGLGDALAARVGIKGPSERGRRDGQYGLEGVPSQQVHIL